MVDQGVLVRGGLAVADPRDTDGPVAVGDAVRVRDPRSGLTGRGRVVEINRLTLRLYLEVDWGSPAA